MFVRGLKGFVLLSFVLSLFLFSSPLYSGEIVREVIDGDTIVLASGERVRYIGINTPEKGQVGYEKARAFNRELVEGKEIRLEFDVQKRDQYGRLLAYVYVDGIFVNAKLVEQGYAQVATYPPNVKYADLFLSLQQQAREANRGLWSFQIDEQEEEGFVASTRSEVFHRASCGYVKRIKNMVWFKTRIEAIGSGRRPCKVCRP